MSSMTPSERDGFLGRMVGPSNVTEVEIGGVLGKALLDTGSQVTTVSESFVKGKLADFHVHSLDHILKVEGAGGNVIPYLGYIEAQIKLPALNIYTDCKLSTQREFVCSDFIIPIGDAHLLGIFSCSFKDKLLFLPAPVLAFATDGIHDLDDFSCYF